MTDLHIYDYRVDVLVLLAAHGVRPSRHTSPAFLREFVSELYRYELRRLRASLLRGEFVRAELADRVLDVRKRYPLLSVPLHQWTTEET